MAFTEDFHSFLDQDEFAEEALYVPAGGGVATPVVVIFDKEYGATLDGLAGGSGPALHCAVADAPGATNGAMFTVRGVTYEVVEPMPDGTGWQTLRLRRAA
jgi:hypothetical protein